MFQIRHSFGGLKLLMEIAESPMGLRIRRGDHGGDEGLHTQRYGRTEIGGYDPAHVHVDRLIAQVAEAYPRARILVIATRQNDVLFLYQRLTERGLRLRRCIWREQFGSWGRGIRRLVLRPSF
jgi:hypothetical protein